MNTIIHTDHAALERDQPVRLAIVVSHPIQYYANFYRRLALESSICLRVFFCSDIGVRPYHDRDMGVTISWASDLLSGYDHVFLQEASCIHNTSFFSINNRSVGTALRSFSPDVVVVHGYAQITMLRVMLWCRASGVPTMMISDSELLHDRPWYLRLAKRVILPLVFARHSAFLNVGSRTDEYLSHYGVPERKMFRSPYPIDEPSLRPVAYCRKNSRTEGRRKFCLSGDALVFLFVGKLIYRKRPADIISAFAMLARSLSHKFNVVAMFAGNGEMRSELEEQARLMALHCLFLGFVNVDNLSELYSAADVLVHPAEEEAYGIVLTEAAFMGLPLIASDRVGAVGPTNTARDGENAIVYPCGNIEALAAAMRRLAEDSELRRRMGEASLRISGELGIRRSVRGVLEALSFVTGRDLVPT